MIRRADSLDRELLGLAIPALGTLAIDPVISLVDTAFVGRLGPVALAALGINVGVFGFAFFIFNFLSNGTTPLVGQAVGRDRGEEAGRIIATALWVAAGLGVLLAGILVAGSHTILGWMGAGEDTLAPAQSYLHIRAFAAPAVLMSLAAHGAFRGLQDTRTPFAVAVGMNTINVVLDPLLIFGLGLGIAGAAMATVVAQWVGAMWLLARLRALDRRYCTLRPPQLDHALAFMSTGKPLVLRTGALVGTFSLATAIAARVGTVSVAAHQVVYQLYIFLSLVVDALAIAAQAALARQVGAGDVQLARIAARRLYTWGGGLGALFAVGLLCLSPWIPVAFTNDPQVAAAIREILPFLVILQPAGALVFVGDGVWMGVADFRFLAVSMVVAAIATSAVLLLVLPMGWGLSGVWWALTALMAIRLFAFAVRHRMDGTPLSGPNR